MNSTSGYLKLTLFSKNVCYVVIRPATTAEFFYEFVVRFQA